jgi:hypothetical protein
MYDIYTKPIHDDFAGDGEEYLVVKDDIVLAHGRSWADPAVVNEFRGSLAGQPISKREKGWSQLRGFDLENAQSWARDVVELTDK